MATWPWTWRGSWPPTRALRRTDIADHALDALCSSRITEVIVLGRRGLAQAAYTTAEVLGLGAAPGLDVVVEAGQQLDQSQVAEPSAEQQTTFSMKAGVLSHLARQPSSVGNKRVVLRYLTSPVEILGDDRVNGLRVCRNKLSVLPDGTLGARPTDSIEDITCGLVLRSVGYRGITSGRSALRRKARHRA